MTPRAPSEATPARLDAGHRRAFRKCWDELGSLYGGEYPLDEIPEALVTARPREMEVRNG